MVHHRRGKHHDEEVHRVKIGDDSTNWNSLPYRAGTPLMATGPLSLTSTSSTSVMTVPVGGLAVVSSVQLLHTSVSSYPASATVRLGPSTNLTQLVDDFSLTVSGANDVTTFDLGNFFYAAGTQLMFGVVSASGAATHVARLVLEGILIPA